jgi:uncharacterized Zn finger protein
MEIKLPKNQSAFRYLNPFRKAIALYALCPSETIPGKLYNVVKRMNLFGSKWACDCPDHVYRERECKHIRTVKAQLAGA